MRSTEAQHLNFNILADFTSFWNINASFRPILAKRMLKVSRSYAVRAREKAKFDFCLKFFYIELRPYRKWILLTVACLSDLNNTICP